MRLQRQDRRHGGEGVAHIGALAGLGSLRDPVEAAQAHGVVDAERTGVAHVAADVADPGPEPARASASGASGAMPQFWPLGL